MIRKQKRKLEVWENVFVRNYQPGGEKWLPGVIQKETGPVSFRVKLSDGQHRPCHQDQVWKRSATVPQDSVVEPDVTISPSEPSIPTEESTPVVTDSSTSESDSHPADPSTESSATRKSYPKRNRTLVSRFEPTCNTWTVFLLDYVSVLSFVCTHFILCMVLSLFFWPPFSLFFRFCVFLCISFLRGEEMW